MLLSIFTGFVPMFFFAWLIYWLDRYEKEPGPLLGGVFVWGAVVAAGGAFLINSLIGEGIYSMTRSEAATNLTTGTLVAPIVEECLKGFAVFIVFLVFRREFDSYLDGVVYAAIVALGFAATENAFYIYKYGYEAGGIAGLVWLAFVRVGLVGWQHPFYTAFIGIGLAASRLSRNTPVKVLAPVTTLFVAVIAHSIHNTLGEVLPGETGLVAGTAYDWTGWLFMLLFITWATFREKHWIEAQLQEEVSLGLITPDEYRIACSAWSQTGARLGALFAGHYQATNRFYQTCAELAHKKQQRMVLGEEGGNTQIIEGLRADLSKLSSQAYRQAKQP